MEDLKMAKTEQRPDTLKTSFKPSEYDQLILDLDFIVASLQVASDHDSDVFDATPIFCEALHQAIEARELVGKMDLARKVAA